MSIEAQLTSLGLSIPDEPQTHLAAAHVVGSVLTTSGRTSPQKGKVGADVSVEDAKAAARDATVRALGAVRATAGSLERVERVLRIDGYVNCVEDFRYASRVVDGASDLIYAVLGREEGRHSRIAVGVAALPNQAAVEVVLTVLLHPAHNQREEGVTR